jgi:hypothetical protein
MTMIARTSCLASGIALTVAVAFGAGEAAAQQPKPEDIEKHETQPQDQYEPSLDVLKDAPIEPQFGLARLFVRAVTGETAVGKQRANLEIKIHLACVCRHGGHGQQEEPRSHEHAA